MNMLSSLICTAVDKAQHITDRPTETKSIMLLDSETDDITTKIFWKYDSALNETYFYIQEITSTISGNVYVEGLTFHFPVGINLTRGLSEAERNEISAVVEHIHF